MTSDGSCSIRTEAEHAEIVVFDGSEKLALRVDASGELSKAYAHVVARPRSGPERYGFARPIVVRP